MASPQKESGFTPTTQEIPKTNYPIPVSNGIFDHREKVGSAIWLFLLLIDWTTVEQDGVGQVLGGKPIKTTKLEKALRLKDKQVRAQLQRLQSIKFIRRRRTSYGFVIEVLKSKKFIFGDRQKVTALSLPDRQEITDQETQTGNYSPLRSAINCRNKEDYTEETKKKSVRGKPSPDSSSPIIGKIIRRLNELAGTSYRPVSNNTSKHLRARIAEGYTLEDFLLVLENKWCEWGNDSKMRKYFRPRTLFGPEHFEDYLQNAKATNGSKPQTPEDREAWRKRTFINA